MKTQHEEAERRLRALGKRLRSIMGPRPLMDDTDALRDVVRKQFAKETGQDVNEHEQGAKRKPEDC